MLRESSSTTAITFCCGASSAMVMAGCHSSTRTVAMSKDCSNQTAPARHLLIFGAACGSRDRISSASPDADATMSSSNTQPGHAPSRTNLPLENTGIGYLKKNWNMVRSFPRSVDQSFLRTVGRAMRHAAKASMRHAVNDVIQRHPKSHGSEGLRVIRIVRPFPGIAQVHVVTDGDHDAALVVANCTPLGHVSVFFVRPPGLYVLFPGNLHALIRIVKYVEDFVLAAQGFRRPVGKNLTHAIHKIFPISSTMEIIHHQEPTFQKVFP